MSLNRLVPRSLYWRILAGTAVWTVIALVVSAIGLTGAFRASAEQGFRSLLEAHSYNVMGALERDEAGRLTGAPDLRDPRFQIPLSGWSWAATDTRDRVASASLAEGALTVPDAPFDDMFRRFVSIEGPMDRELLVLEAQILVDEGKQPVTVQIAGDTADIEARVVAFERRLLLFFALFGLGLLLATALILRLGLRPLDRSRAQLAAIRDGERETLDGDQPLEIQPLVDEVNALLASNRDVIERSRRQVGNLAHALKTPLTVLRNEAGASPDELARTLREQTDAMRVQIDTYLDRARIAAVRNNARARAPVAATVAPLMRTIGKLAPDTTVVLAGTIPDDLAFGGDASDLEELLGNLLENASRFADRRVELTVSPGPNGIAFLIDDDGPGLSEDERARAVSRGVRLDERRSGSGLGLSIVSDIIDAYDGSLALERSPLGGLRARLTLPYASPVRRGA